MAKRDISRRERLDTHTGNHFAKRDAKGRFKEMDNVGRSLAADRRTKAECGGAPRGPLAEITRVPNRIASGSSYNFTSGRLRQIADLPSRSPVHRRRRHGRVTRRIGVLLKTPFSGRYGTFSADGGNRSEICHHPHVADGCSFESNARCRPSGEGMPISARQGFGATPLSRHHSGRHAGQILALTTQE